VAKGYRYLDPQAVARLSKINLIARSVVEGFISGLHRSPFRGFSVEFAEHREYTPGDNIKDIDWQAYGRTDRYVVKQYQEETNLKAHILLDTSGSMGYKSEESSLSKLEYGSYLAASLAYMMVRQQDSVGLVTFSEKINHFIPPRSTTAHLNVMLKTLETAHPGQATNISRTFHDLAEHIKRRGLIIIISDLFDDAKDVMRGLRHFRFKRHEVILFHIFDRWEIDFPFRRLTDFVDMETNDQLQIDPRFVRDDYMHRIRDFIGAYKRECAGATIEYVQTHTGVPFDLMLHSFLAKRKRLH